MYQFLIIAYLFTFPTIKYDIAEFSAEKPLVFNSRETIQSFDNIKIPSHVVKYGVTTGLTIGLLRSYGSAVHICRPSFHPDDRVRMHQQLEVFSIAEPFAKEGDSGTLVFSVCTVGDTTDIKALGLLAGGTDSGISIVTTIWAIFNKLQLPLQLYEPRHDKTNKVIVRPASVQSDKSLRCPLEDS